MLYRLGFESRDWDHGFELGGSKKKKRRKNFSIYSKARVISLFGAAAHKGQYFTLELSSVLILILIKKN